MEDSFWESRFFAFQTYRKRTSDLTCCIDVFPSSLVSAQSTRSLTERRITHIVSVCTDPIPAHHPQSGIRYLRVPVEDQPYEDLLIWMPHTCRFIDEALRTGGVVLVHGVHGLSRGATIMAAYCMITVSRCLVLQYPDPLTPSNVVPARQCSHGHGHG
jgi:protein-tyrosine phosphatase